MTSPKKPKRTRSYYAGEKKCNRVRLWAHHRDGTLFLEYRDEAGKRHNASLRHTDLGRGKQAADELAAALRKQEGPRTSGETTLKELFDNYVRDVTPTKSDAKQQHDRAARLLFETCWGSTTRVKELDRRDWDGFITRRRSGDLRPAGRESAGGVRDCMIGYDLRFIMAVCNWAEAVRVNGRLLIDRNPFRKCPIPAESSPRRPSTTEAEYQGLCVAAKELASPEIELFLYLMHDLGHRGKSVRSLRWGAIDLPGRRVVWSGDSDKMKREHSTPLLPEHVDALKRILRQNRTIGDGWLFPSPENPAQPISRRQVSRWWQQLEERAKLPRVKGRGWHSLRRKFADENDELPMSQLMALGGWKSSRTIVEIYQKPGEEKLRAGLTRRLEVRKASILAHLTTASDNQLDQGSSGPLPQVAATA